MNTTTITTRHQDDTTVVAHPASAVDRRSRRPRASRRVAGLAVALATLVAAASVGFSAPASAATAGWRWLDLTGDRWNETAAWVDTYGRYTTVYSDPDQDGVWNLQGDIDPSTGRWTQIRFDTNANRTWDTIMQWKSNNTTLVWGNTGSEFDGNWDDLTVAIGSRVEMTCWGQNQPIMGYAMVQAWGAWWVGCNYPSYGSGLSGLITKPIYANMFDSLRAATGVTSSYCMFHLYGDPTC